MTKTKTPENDMVKDLNTMKLKNKFALLYNTQHSEITAIANIISGHIRNLEISYEFCNIC